MSETAHLIERLNATARDLVSLTNGVSMAVLSRRPSLRDWSALMIIGHLADAELVYALRVKQVLVDDRPHFMPYDEGVWVERFARLEEDLKDTVARWRLTREHTVRLLESLEDAEWRRTGVHSTRGELSMRQLVTLMADHDRQHLDQLRRAVAGV